MSDAVNRPRRRTLEEWLDAPESKRLELVAGEFVQKAAPSAEHGFVQSKVITSVASRFNRRPGGKNPGGWWIVAEVDICLGEDGFRPDLAGWRRERVPELPKERPATVRPDWICEIVSPSNAAQDRVVKMRSYHRAGVPHYWLVDPEERTLVVMRHAAAGYVTVLAATEQEVVRPEPFEAVELAVRGLFGDDDE
ncbi:MAG: Uma2 family endonuclease [Myxococcales bacterium]|nr:Uma2 family endonuclease [Myxococcales bacterium]